MSFSRKGNFAITAHDKNSVILWDLRTDPRISLVVEETNPYDMVAIQRILNAAEDTLEAKLKGN